MVELVFRNVLQSLVVVVSCSPHNIDFSSCAPLMHPHTSCKQERVKSILKFKASEWAMLYPKLLFNVAILCYEEEKKKNCTRQSLTWHDMNSQSHFHSHVRARTARENEWVGGKQARKNMHKMMIPKRKIKNRKKRERNLKVEHSKEKFNFRILTYDKSLRLNVTSTWV